MNSLLVAHALFQLSTRFRNNVDEKVRKLGYIGVGVSAVGQGLVDTITKTCVTFYAVDVLLHSHSLKYVNYGCDCFLSLLS